MALLDDLKKQAQQKQSQGTLDSSKTLRGEEVNWHLIAPKLFTLRQYLKELVETLNSLEPDDDHIFTLTKDVTFRKLKKRNFKFNPDQQKDGRSFTVRYELTGEHNQRLSVGNDVMINKIRTLLKDLATKFDETNDGANRSAFVIKPLFTTRIKCEASLPDRMINLTIENFSAPGAQQIRIKPETINEEFMDEFAKFILGHQNKFMELAGYTMPEELRRQLQEKLSQGKQAKAAPEEAAKAETRLESTASRLKNIFKR
jgi:hypothetical protein